MSSRRGLVAAIAALSFAAILVVQPVSAATAPKVGARCAKVGSVARAGALTLRCAASHRWVRVARVPAPKPTPEPTVPPKPVAADAPIATASYPEVAQQARTAILQGAPSGASTVDVRVTLESTVPAATQANLRSAVQAATNRLSRFWNGLSRIALVGFVTRAWGESTVDAWDPGNAELAADMARTFPNWGAAPTPGCTGLGGFSVGYLKFPLIAIQSGCDWSNPRQLAGGIDPSASVVPHELVHMTQSKYGNTANPRCVEPVWLVEGQAQVVGSAIAESDGVSRAIEARNVWSQRLADPASVTLQQLEVDGPSKQEYQIGATAVEYLIARSGFMRSLDVTRAASDLLGASQCRNGGGSALMAAFRQAFQSTYGQSLDDFYAEVQPYLAYVYRHGTELTPLQTLAPGDTRTRVTLGEGCHGVGVADLQRQVGGVWVDVSPAMGWGLASGCSAPTAYRPWTLANVQLGDVLRWHVYAPGNWDWYSTPYTQA